MKTYVYILHLPTGPVTSKATNHLSQLLINAYALVADLPDAKQYQQQIKADINGIRSAIAFDNSNRKSATDYTKLITGKPVFTKPAPIPDTPNKRTYADLTTESIQADIQNHRLALAAIAEMEPIIKPKKSPSKQLAKQAKAELDAIKANLPPGSKPQQSAVYMDAYKKYRKLLLQVEK